MARKRVWIGSRGPFLFDDQNTYSDGVNHVGLRSETVVGAPNYAVENLTTNVRLVLSNADKEFEEVNNLKTWIQEGSDISITDNGDGTVTINSTGGAVDSVFGRTGAVTAQSGDYSFPQISGAGSYGVSNFDNDAGYITTIPSTYLESGDNVSELTNDAGYITSGVQNGDTPDFNAIDFANHEKDDYSIDGRLYWDLSAGMYIQSSNADHGNPALLWSSANFGAGSNLSVSYSSEDHPTLSVVTNPVFNGVRIGKIHTYHGVESTSAANNGHLMLDSSGGGNLYLNWSASGEVKVESAMDLNGHRIYDVNYIDIDGRVRLNSDTHRPGLLRTDNLTGSYAGLQMYGDNGNAWAIMAHSVCGIYDDSNSNWHVYCVQNGRTELRYNGSTKLETESGGVEITGHLQVISSGSEGIEFGDGFLSGELVTPSADGHFFTNSKDSSAVLRQSGSPNRVFIGGGSQRGVEFGIDGAMWASNYGSLSDANTKSDEEPMPSVLEGLLNITPHKYAKGASKTVEYGRYAQDVKRYFPDVVSKTADNKLALDLGSLITINSKGVQELHEIIQAQQKEINKLKTMIGV